jgi:uncharacterized protein with von Willebrand factor type A (vWA) domain
MRARILRFVEELRAAGLPVSVSETMDAVAAVAAAGVEREVLREALATTVVKDEHDRPEFDRLFDLAFPLGDTRVRGKRRHAAGGSEEPSVGRDGAGDAGAGLRARPPSDPDEVRGAARRHPTSPARERPGDEGPMRVPAAGRRALLRRPLDQLDPRDVEEMHDLVRELGHRIRGRLARRERRRRRGRIDVRRMLRAAVATGGVPLREVRRHRRPDRGDLLAPAASFFRRVHVFAYVDRLCPIAVEGEHVTPEGPLDLHARSDFGHVLDELARDHAGLLTRRTLLLVVGDARNNRRPARGDLLRRVRDHVQRLVWLVPEPRRRWNTGDSALDRYAPACDAVLECDTLGALLSALRATL